jgi:glycerate kinase
MHILIAPNTFKNSLSASEAANALEKGLRQSGLKFTCTRFPVGDGGDGTGGLLTKHFKGKLLTTWVKDPLGRFVQADMGLSPDKDTAIIELASASGLRLLSRREYRPLIASTRGAGMLIRAALDVGVSKILLCLGGSATIDGGCGLMRELGVRFIDSVGTVIEDFPLGLTELQTIDCSAIDSRLFKTEIKLLCDVNTKLLGRKGAAAVYGPQKGAKPEDIRFLEQCLTKLDDVVAGNTGKRMSSQPFSGAAGGTAALLAALGGAKAMDGAKYFLELTGFERHLKRSDWVITGEGSLDGQTLEGKVPFQVARMAKDRNLRVAGVAGVIDRKAEKDLKKYFDMLIRINPPRISLPVALTNTSPNLLKAGFRIGQWLREP